MTALILQTTPFVELVAMKFRAVYARFLQALDTFAEAKMRSAVPQWQLRKAQRDISRCRRLMHADHKSPVKPVRNGH